MDFTLKIWRQENHKAKGRFETYKIKDISPDCSFLEMLDILNESLVNKLSHPVCFDNDCREGISTRHFAVQDVGGDGQMTVQ